MRSLPRFPLLVAVVVLFGLGACAESEPEDDSQATGLTSDTARGAGEEPEGEPAEEPAGSGLTAVASVYPLAWVAGQIAPGANVELLTDAGDDPHDIELTPRGRQLFETADVVLYMGDISYQPQVETAVGSSAGQVVSFAEVVGTTALIAWDNDDSHNDDDHSHNDDDHSHNDDHAHGEYDAHAWFDASLMAEVAVAIGAAFAAADADNVQTYESNATALADAFRNLDGEIDAMLAGDCAHDLVVVSHEAYSYLLSPHGLRQEGVSGAGGHGPASPQRIAQLVTLIRERGIEFVLAEPVEGREDAIAVATEAEVEILDIFSLEVVDDGDLFAERGFLELLWEQAETTAKALACD